jgi:hypothetical protein
MNTPLDNESLKRKMADFRRRYFDNNRTSALNNGQTALSKRLERERREAARQQIAPEPIEFDSRWSWACALFKKKCRGNLSFLKV